MINAPGMTSRGKRIAFLIAIIIAFLLPKHVECGFPDGRCGREGVFHQVCKSYELEPLGVYLLEVVAKQDVGFAYKSGEDCR